MRDDSIKPEFPDKVPGDLQSAGLPRRRASRLRPRF